MGSVVVIDSAELGRLLAVEQRYEFLQSAVKLSLTSGGGVWFREDGSRFEATHHLCGNYTSYAAYPTLDETIDAAIQLEKDSPYTNHIKRKN